MNKLRVLRFWIIAFSVLIFNTLKGNNWHMIFADFHFGDNERGIPIRKRLIAQQHYRTLDVYWQDLTRDWEIELDKYKKKLAEAG